MTTENFNPEANKLPSSLNTLTILTFIGSGLQLISGGWQYINADKGYAKMQETISSPDFDKMPEFAKKMMSPQALENARLAAENKIPLLVLALLGGILGIVGALQMRKLKMQGYYVWLISEIVPLIGTAIFMGLSAFSGFAMIGLIFPLLFIVLYTLQRKHLTNK
jgi:hypothetical protein